MKPIKNLLIKLLLLFAFSTNVVAQPIPSFRFASADVRYKQNETPPDSLLSLTWQGNGWRGEKIHTQLLAYSPRQLNNVSITMSDLTGSGKSVIPAKYVKTNFVGYVMTDGLNDYGGGCGLASKPDSSLVADVLNNISQTSVPANTIQPVWLTVQIPPDTKAGLYKGTITLFENNVLSKGISLHYTVMVGKRLLPQPADWKFHLDLWQNPYAVSRVNNVPEWSAAHFKALEPVMQMLADAGQKTVTTTLMHDPWNSQTYDKYGGMIKWTKKSDGNWLYDYSIFDKWVSFMDSIGINKQINCYSMIPWGLKFYYHDEAAGKDSVLVAKPGSAEYEALWKPMLTDFAKHLIAKGWFNKTAIAMDESAMESMKQVIALVKSVNKDFKIALAGGYHAEIEADIFDYCLASNQIIADTTLQSRKNQHKVTTFYTSCTEGRPNTFTFSAPAEATWLPWFAINKNYDGYLRWAYNCWNKNPLYDSRFGKWAAGDAFIVYPGGRSSIRFEKLISGIQDYEKFQILQQELSHTKGEKLQTVTKPFVMDGLNTQTAAPMLIKARQQLNSF